MCKPKYPVEEACLIRNDDFFFLQIELTKKGLQATLLVKAPETEELFVNFDPQILTLIREADCMAHMRLEIPPFASVIQQQRNWYKKIANDLHVGLL